MVCVTSILNITRILIPISQTVEEEEGIYKTSQETNDDCRASRYKLEKT